jgi:hypothetical protein
MSWMRAAGVGLIVVACAGAGMCAAVELTPDQAQVLAAARTFALGYTDKLPNFICSQITTRASFNEKLPANIVGHGNAGPRFQQPINMGEGDRIVERLTYFNQEEKYEVVSIDGKPAPKADHLQLTGAISVGEFGTALRDIFRTSTGTEFDWHGVASIRGRHVYVYDFKVPKDSGIEVRDQIRNADLAVGYSGLVYVDAATGEVLRMTSSLDLPTGLSIVAAERSVDYEPVTIADKKYTLPVRSEVMLENDDSRYVNKIEFKDYRKFGAESIIHYGDSVAPGAP